MLIFLRVFVFGRVYEYLCLPVSLDFGFYVSLFTVCVCVSLFTLCVCSYVMVCICACVNVTVCTCVYVMVWLCVCVRNGVGACVRFTKQTKQTNKQTNKKPTQEQEK